MTTMDEINFIDRRLNYNVLSVTFGSTPKAFIIQIFQKLHI